MNKAEVLRAMELSALAYNETQALFPDFKLTVIDDVASGVQCYIRAREDSLYITFRGTDNLKDWKTDLTFWKKCIPYNNNTSKIRVHTGFINAYKSQGVRDKIQSQVKDEIKKICITGHSFGAALAVLCAVDLQYNFPDKDFEALIFGCPRVGNRAFKKSYNKRVFKTLRVENGNDIVTKVPFPILGFRHVGIKIHVGMPRITGAVSANDHRPQSYYSKLFTELK